MNPTNILLPQLVAATAVLGAKLRTKDEFRSEKEERRKEVGRVGNSKINVNVSANCDVIPNHWSPAAGWLFESRFLPCATIFSRG